MKKENNENFKELIQLSVAILFAKIIFFVAIAGASVGRSALATKKQIFQKQGFPLLSGLGYSVLQELLTSNTTINKKT